MAVESKRGCGFRQVGGLYMMAGKLAAPCDRLPFELSVCPCCGAGIKFTRGFTWIQPAKLFDGDHGDTLKVDGKPTVTIGCRCDLGCPVCYPEWVFPDDGRAGLLWIGHQFYKTPREFIDEGIAQGVSRRVTSIPRGFKIGETWVFCAHIRAIEPTAEFGEKPEHKPGIFAAFRPTHFERIVLQSEFDVYRTVVDRLSDFADLDDEERDESVKRFFEHIEPGIKAIYDKLHSDASRGIKLVPVPDDDTDHNPKGK